MVKNVGAAAAAKAEVGEKKVRKPRSTEGVAEAKAAAKMTKEQWQKHQVGMDEKWPVPDYMKVEMPGRSHTNYRDETYALVTRWTAETKISYRPHAKAPGSKSHLRYEKYAKAKTVAQALKLGSWPQDWCWDYERGFIKVDGPLREEPIDITQHTEQDDPLTEVDQVIYRWYNKELAKNLGLNYRDLFGTTDPSILRAHRLVAQREARARLAKADAKSRRISDEDVVAVLSKWAFVKNAARSNVIPSGQHWVWSDTMGLIRDRVGSIHTVPSTKLYPEVVQLIVRWLRERMPKEASDFTFTSLNLNYNYAARRHRDGNNFGPSMIKAFGPFKGGQLSYWPEDDKSLDLEKLPENKKVSLSIGGGSDGGLALFNGNSAHQVEDFEGHRFSVVYFTLGCHDRAADADREYLGSLGIPFPAPDEDRQALLRAPLGYGRAAAKTPASGGADQRRPTVMFWKNAVLEKQKFKPLKLPRVEPFTGKPSKTMAASGGGGGGAVQKRILKRPARA